MATFDIVGDQITAVYFVRNPDKLVSVAAAQPLAR